VAGTPQVAFLSNGVASVEVTRRRERNNWAIMVRVLKNHLKRGVMKLWVETRKLSLALFYRFGYSGK